ncbi:MAG: type II toxin-antitoxin system VapC family toxin [Betaproteobacteria bacterium]|nr:type II toxin-antitoxin system VapC family toxin [Betaproteobacteria bacterium]
MAVDTSALMAILLDEPEADACDAALQADSNVLISAGTLAEALIVSLRQGVHDEVFDMVDRMAFEVVAVTRADALRAGQAYSRWGRGTHRSGLNYGDCFAYALAKERACPLLYVGKDFARTDIARVL